MTAIVTALGGWNWLILGFVLMALELLAPGVFLFWLGLAALLVGLLALLLDPGWQAQILLFALFAAAAVPLWRRMARGGDVAAHASDPFLNRRTDALVGREFTLENRSRPASARCGSTTQCGGCSAPTLRPAAGCGSSRRMGPS
jgi:membrane protein implicated in regulation of membrane protease activity